MVEAWRSWVFGVRVEFGWRLGGVGVVFGLAFGWCLAFGIWVEDDDDDDGFGMNPDGDRRPSLSRHRYRRLGDVWRLAFGSKMMMMMTGLG